MNEIVKIIMKENNVIMAENNGIIMKIIIMKIMNVIM
jgi:hypothetical protein